MLPNTDLPALTAVNLLSAQNRGILKQSKSFAEIAISNGVSGKPAKVGEMYSTMSHSNWFPFNGSYVYIGAIIAGYGDLPKNGVDIIQEVGGSVLHNYVFASSGTRQMLTKTRKVVALYCVKLNSFPVIQKGKTHVVQVVVYGETLDDLNRVINDAILLVKALKSDTPNVTNTSKVKESISRDKNDPDVWTCVCGNITGDTGFFPCNEKGEEVEPTKEAWKTGYYACYDCGRFFRGDTLEVVGRDMTPSA